LDSEEYDQDKVTPQEPLESAHASIGSNAITNNSNCFFIIIEFLVVIVSV
jgi:hypothetical protein